MKTLAFIEVKFVCRHKLNCDYAGWFEPVMNSQDKDEQLVMTEKVQSHIQVPVAFSDMLKHIWTTPTTTTTPGQLAAASLLAWKPVPK